MMIHMHHLNIQDQHNDLSLQDFRYYTQLEYSTPQDDGSYKTFLTFQNVTPPEAGTRYIAIDQGSASPKYIRSSMYYMPESEVLRSASKLPVSVTIRPFAPLLDTEDPVPVVDMKRDYLQTGGDDPLSKGPIRCRRCRTYVNASFQFTNNNKFICNICQFANNSVPDDYVSYLDNQGLRVDRFQRPELHKGVYDLLVPPEYNFGGLEKPAESLHHVFLIDISEQSIKQNVNTVIADSIRATLYGQQQPEQQQQALKVSIIAFDKRLHFYNLSADLDTTQVVVSSDLDDPFVPFFEGLFVDPHDSRNVIEDALNHLERLNSDDHYLEAESCFAVACKTAMLALEQVGGGKITAVLASLPSWGPGALRIKDNKAIGRSGIGSIEVEKSLYLADNDYYKALQKEFIDKSVGMDLHVISNASVDLSNVGWLASVSGGKVYRWSNFHAERDGRALTSRINDSITATTGYQGQLKVRCSNGLQVSQYYGTSSSVAETSVAGGIQDPVVPILSKDQTFTVLFEYDGKLNKRYDCHIQVALLYTDPEGIRKVRIINLVLAVSERLEEIFAFADENAVVTTIIRDSLSFVGKQPLNELRESVNQKLVEVFTQYRAMEEYGHNSSRTLTNQMLFPTSLKNLPHYLLAFIKTKAIRNSSTISADSRLHDIYDMLTMPIDKLMYHLYPALVELHSLTDEQGLINESTNLLSLPLYKAPSIKSMEPGVYILCNGSKVYVWVDPHANILLIKDLFGDHIESPDELDPLMDELPAIDTTISIQARNIIQYFNEYLIGTSTLEMGGIQLVRPGIDGSEIEFREALVDDSLHGTLATSSGPNIADYLSSLHKAIRVQLENDKVKQSVTATEVHHDTLAQRMIHF
ncbi:sec-24-like membrane protein [Scheffersomyces amazonensis]|uniref:sec-24-like membrane protein n=1 Tax=Scheffersomyces amazonensis TaxID=1078765 RepID=UPI00315CD87B